MEEAHGVHHLLMKVLCRLIGHLKVQVVGIKSECRQTDRQSYESLVHPALVSSYIQLDVPKLFFPFLYHFGNVPLHWIPQHDDDPGAGLSGVDEVLGQKRRPGLLLLSVDVAPGLVVPHGRCTGLTCQDQDSWIVTPVRQVFD